MSALLEMGVEGIGARFHCLSCRIDERLGAPFRVDVDVEVQREEQPAGALSLDLLGRPAWFVLTAHGTERRFEGMVDSIEDQEGHSVVTIVASVAPLGDNRDYRVIPGKSALDVADAIFGPRGISVVVRAHATPPVRAQHVQSFESDLDFVARVLAEEGLFWVPSTSKRDEVRILSEPSSFEDDGLVLPYREEAGLQIGRSIFGIRVVRRAASDRAILRAYDFERPELDLQGESGDGALAWYEFSDDTRSPSEAAARANVRLAERRRSSAVLFGEATAPGVAAGSVVTIEGAPLDAQNGRFLVLSVYHEVFRNEHAAELSYRARLEAVPATSLVCPDRMKGQTRGGVGTSITTGPAGKEIAVDAFGRTTQRLRWDRRNDGGGERSSAPARVLEPELAGAAFHPRVGWEEVHAFLDGACEDPLVLGRLYNGADPPPLVLPAEKVETHLGTMTSPSGERGHFIKISDAAGKEQLSVQSSGDYEELSENDKVSQVMGALARTVGGSHELFVKENFSTGVSAAHSLSVGAVRSVTTNADYAISAASESITAAGARLFSVGGDLFTKAPRLVRLVGAAKTEAPVEHQSVFTEGPFTLVVGGSLVTTAGLSEAVGVGGAAITKVSGAMGVTCNGYGLDVLGLYAESFASRAVTAGGKIGETFGALSHSVKGGATIAGSNVLIEGTASLTIKAGGMTVKMTPASITIDGDFKGSVGAYETGGRSEYG